MISQASVDSRARLAVKAAEIRYVKMFQYLSRHSHGHGMQLKPSDISNILVVE
jgi:hypothetical protein